MLLDLTGPLKFLAGLALVGCGAIAVGACYFGFKLFVFIISHK